MRDAKINRSRAPRPISVHEEVEPLSAADMLSSVEAERELISAEDINNNIDKHRPAKTKHILAKKEFDGLAKELHDGFTVPQLTRYLENLEITVRSKAVKTLSGPKPTEELPVLERSAWTSGITPFVERKLDSGLYYDSGYLTRKQNLAIRVLRNGWNLKIKEEVDSIGELELRVTPQKLSLLLHEGKPLDSCPL